MKYTEDFKKSEQYKQRYVDSIEKFIGKRQEEASFLRKKYAENILTDTEKYREDFISLLGFPLTEYDGKNIPLLKTEKLSDEEGYCIYRVSAEVLPDFCMTGLLFKRNCDGKRPLVIVQHGGEGTPELISGIYKDTHNYHDMLMRTLEKNVHVFAPQLLLWNEQYGVPFDRETIDAKLKAVGSSITALELYSLRKFIDCFEKEDCVSSFGMVGLSYGGFYTLFASAVEKRIRSAVSCAYFNSRDNYFTSDWTWFDFSKKFNDAEIACLSYPRNLYIEVAKNDDLFDYRYAVKSFERVKEICNGNDAWIDFSVYEGCHEFDKNEIFVDRMVHDLEVFDERKKTVREFLGKTVTVKIDRPIGFVHRKEKYFLEYPINYGYIPGVLGGDGEELDVYLLGVSEAVSEYTAKIIGIVHRQNDCEDKLVAAPEGMCFTKEEIEKAVRFQEQYYDSDAEVL